MKLSNILTWVLPLVFLSACVTTPTPGSPDGSSTPPSGENPDGSTNGNSGQDAGDTGTPGTITPIPDPGSNQPPVSEPPTYPPVDERPAPARPITVDIGSAYGNLANWQTTDLRPALKAFQRSCTELQARDQNEYFIEAIKDYGRVQDWTAPCNLASVSYAEDMSSARGFFESEFIPVRLSSEYSREGLLTAYYQPEIFVRRVKDSVYSEPILTKPRKASGQNLPRSRINETTSSVIAYGKSIEVFFMQIQGSGVLHFNDGEKLRAAYAANNGYSYTSIGRVLIDRGELTKDQASKKDIENWMIAAGPAKSRELMNENKRYIFFAPETILPGEGPKGAMRVPLTAMGSVAVDPRYHAYGTPLWVETKIPVAKGDYIGSDQSLLVIAQDTGKAIRGKLRGDLYFGSGFEAGDRAGVMKHPANWTVLLPFNIALQLASRS